MLDKNVFVRDTLRLVTSEIKTKYLVFFLHGWGSDGNDLIQLAQYWKKDLKEMTFLAPNAPSECSANPSGRQWFDIITNLFSILLFNII